MAFRSAECHSDGQSGHYTLAQIVGRRNDQTLRGLRASNTGGSSPTGDAPANGLAIGTGLAGDRRVRQALSMKPKPRIMTTPPSLITAPLPLSGQSGGLGDRFTAHAIHSGILTSLLGRIKLLRIKTPAGSSSPLPQHTLVPQMQALSGIILDRCITDAHDRGVSGY
jgi:hypothetical protein